ncbi:MAG: hypothetical protein COW88_01775 [Candidatus Lloydbacteria bacterium CG22_combo_CG10-13_8_21_14_all_47_15]|uniref:Transcriptional regulator n=1 Tax=Candidatus Lloydbacteria bacterium CG22_combo_CG10-13_8_21_14_all_47_15 TaxID=1974635 RepID=A0A2H0CUD8_9BACT|nr:MAG: hypothetical protein COW88_01775 [Candidatus Lloydbacteria bacterium CG22_combo_CG10-13_8_21_14_all_47_15]
MDILGKLFGGTARIKIMRLFLLNPELAFLNRDIAYRSKVSGSTVRRETGMLYSVGFIRYKRFFKERKPRINSKGKPGKKAVIGWQLDPAFPLLNQFYNLLSSSGPIKTEDIVTRCRRGGKVKLIIISGIFIHDPDSRVDLLIVGDRLKRGMLEQSIRLIEAEVGRELHYAVFDTKDFLYRHGMYDKFIRDILDYPHEKIFDKIGID